MIPPKVSISGYMGMIKDRTAIRVLNKFKKLKQKPYWDNKFRTPEIAAVAVVSALPW